MKNYLFLIESLSVSCGGPARVAALVSGELAERGHNVKIINILQSDTRVAINPKVHLLTIAGSISNPLTLFKATSLLKEESKKADVVIVSGMWGLIDGFALRLANLPTSKIHIRTCGMLEDYILNRSVWKKKLARLFYVNSNLNRVSKLLVNTKIEAEKIKALGINSKMKVISNGVSIPKNSSKKYDKNIIATSLNIDPSNSIKYLLYLGRIHPKKGLDILLPAFADFQKKYPEWRLLVAGTFSDELYEQKIRSLITEFSIDGVKFLGEVKGEEKLNAFKLASAFILPSLSEGFSNAVIEAMSYSLPVIITSGCNFPEVAEYKAGIVCEAEKQSLSDALFKLLPDYDLQREFGLNARQMIIDFYSTERVIDAYESLSLNDSESNVLEFS